MRHHAHTRTLPGFTVLELLLVMILSGVISAMIYQMTTVFFGLHHAYVTRNQEAMHLQHLHWKISRDLLEAESIHAKETGFTTFSKRGDRHVRVDPDYLIRTSGEEKDSLKVSQGRLTYTPLAGSSTWIVSVHFEYSGLPIAWRFRKAFTAAERFQMKDDEWITP